MNKIYLKKEKINLYILLFLYKTIIEISYVMLISKVYDYYGFILDFNLVKYMYSLLFFMLMLYFIPEEKSLIRYYVIILIVLIYIPSISYFSLSNQKNLFFGYISISYFILILIVSNFGFTNFLRIKNSKLLLYLIFTLYIFSLSIIIVKRGGIDSRAFSFDSIYSLRREDNISGILGYFINWDTKAFFPFFCAYFLFKKNKIGVLVVVLMQLLAYLSFGNKTFIVAIIASVGIYFLYKFKDLLKMYLIGMNGIACISLLSYFFNIFSFLSNTFLFRMVFVPTLIQYQYFDFFSTHEKLYFAEGVIGKIFQIPSAYPDAIASIISFIYRPELSTADTFSNTGFISDSFANLGIIGIVIITTLLAVVLLFIKANTIYIPKNIILSSSIVILFNLMDNSFLTTFLTSGLFWLILLFMILNSLLWEEKRYD